MTPFRGSYCRPANRMLGVATLDRLRHGAYRLILEGDSFRAPRSLPESPKNTIAKGAKNTILNTVRNPISDTLKWRLLTILGHDRR